MIDDYKNSPNYGKEIFVPVTIIETPPIIPLAIRIYGNDSKGINRSIGEYWTDQVPDILKRRIKIGKQDKRFEDLKSLLNRASSIRIIAMDQPHLVKSLGRKTPDLFEVQVSGGKIEDRLDYAFTLLGKQVDVRNVFAEGQFIDVIGVTKGKGFQGVIKRYGVTELPRWHKHRKGSRKIGARGPSMGTPSYVPQPGQMGFHRRTIYNLRILRIGDNGEEVTPKGGFISYGKISGTYLMVKGSVLGPRKRVIYLRQALRPSISLDKKAAQITYIDLTSKQG